MPVLKPRADLMSIIEAAYAAETDEMLWARALAAALRDCVDGALQTGLLGIAHGDDFADAVIAFNAGTDPEWVERSTSQVASALSPSMVQTFFYPGIPCSTASELEAPLPPEARAAARARRGGAEDAFALFTHPKQGVAAVLWTVLGGVRSLARSERLACQ